MAIERHWGMSYYVRSKATDIRIHDTLWAAANPKAKLLPLRRAAAVLCLPLYSFLPFPFPCPALLVLPLWVSPTFGISHPPRVPPLMHLNRFLNSVITRTRIHEYSHQVSMLLMWQFNCRWDACPSSPASDDDAIRLPTTFPLSCNDFSAQLSSVRLGAGAGALVRAKPYSGIVRMQCAMQSCLVSAARWAKRLKWVLRDFR